MFDTAEFSFDYVTIILVIALIVLMVSMYLIYRSPSTQSIWENIIEFVFGKSKPSETTAKPVVVDDKINKPAPTPAVTPPTPAVTPATPVKPAVTPPTPAVTPAVTPATPIVPAVPKPAARKPSRPLFVTYADSITANKAYDTISKYVNNETVDSVSIGLNNVDVVTGLLSKTVTDKIGDDVYDSIGMVLSFSGSEKTGFRLGRFDVPTDFDNTSTNKQFQQILCFFKQFRTRCKNQLDIFVYYYPQLTNYSDLLIRLFEEIQEALKFEKGIMISKDISAPVKTETVDPTTQYYTMEYNVQSNGTNRGGYLTAQQVSQSKNTIFVYCKKQPISTADLALLFPPK